jgi:prephenate dehydratase
VREVAATDDVWAALGTPLAGELYGAVTIAEDLGDEPANATRFVWLAREGDTLGDGEGNADWKSSVVFSGDGDGSPGWLVRCLSEFAFRGVNLTRIESRPARRRLGHYVFLLDLTGRADQPGAAADAVAGLSAHCEELRVLGSYPRAAGVPIP